MLKPHKLEELPAYLYGYCCDDKHFLSLNRDIQGKWCAAYTAWGDGTEHALPNLFVNSAETVDQAANLLSLKMRKDDAQTA